MGTTSSGSMRSSADGLYSADISGTIEGPLVILVLLFGFRRHETAAGVEPFLVGLHHLLFLVCVRIDELQPLQRHREEKQEAGAAVAAIPVKTGVVAAATGAVAAS